MAARKMFEQAESSGCASRLPNLHVRHRAVTCRLTPQSAPATCPDGQFPFGCPHVLGAAFRGCRGGTSRAHLLPSLTQFDWQRGNLASFERHRHTFPFPGRPRRSAYEYSWSTNEFLGGDIAVF